MTTYNNTPHPHAELIKAWADGAHIQYKWYGKWIDAGDPIWHIGTQYRVKPTNVMRYVPVIKMPAGALFVGSGVISEDCAKKQVAASDQLVGVLHIELDPATGELVSTQLVKPRRGS